MWFKLKYHYFPLATALCLALTITICPAVAISANHMGWNFPFISDSGAYPPDSSIYGQMLTFCGILLALTGYYRYKTIKMVINAGDLDVSHRTNKILLITMLLASLGTNITGQFQETYAVWPHVFASGLAFGCAEVYMIGDVYISQKMRHVFERYSQYNIGSKSAYLKIITTVCYCVLFNLTSVCALLAYLQYKGTNVNIPKWSAEDGGFLFKQIASVAEWLLIIALMIILVVMSKEMKLVQEQKGDFQKRIEINDIKSAEANAA